MQGRGVELSFLLRRGRGPGEGQLEARFVVTVGLRDKGPDRAAAPGAGTALEGGRALRGFLPIHDKAVDYQHAQQHRKHKTYMGK
jgi:hypothetical protein